MDLQISIYLNQLWRGTFIDKITSLISSNLFLATIGACLIIVSIALDKTKGKKIFIAIFIAAIFHFLINEYFLKHLLGEVIDLRERPYIAYPDYIKEVGIQKFQDASFPSSHMAALLLTITVFYNYYRKKIILSCGIIFTVLMAFARIHNGMHYPSDVFAGAMLGIIYGLIGIYITTKKS